MAGMDFSKLLGQINAVTTKKSFNDDNKHEYWKPTKDKAGNASAVIRFLPNSDVEEVPFVRMWSHSFKNGKFTPPRYYIENSLTTIGKQDYIGDMNKELWATGLKENQDICKLQKRKLQYISNILVIKDTGMPENNGKVFKYKYGQKIFEKISGAAQPNVELGEVAINAFDVYEGANFLLQMQKANDQFNYDASKFGVSKSLFGGDDDEIEEVLKQCFDLSLEIAPDKFKSEADLKSKYLWVTGQPPSAVQDQETTEEIDELEKLIAEKPKKVTADEKKVKKPSPPMPVMDAKDDDSDAAFFASLAG